FVVFVAFGRERANVGVELVLEAFTVLAGFRLNESSVLLELRCEPCAVLVFFSRPSALCRFIRAVPLPLGLRCQGIELAALRRETASNGRAMLLELLGDAGIVRLAFG